MLKNPASIVTASQNKAIADKAEDSTKNGKEKHTRERKKTKTKK